jgi:hypothetical protein
LATEPAVALAMWVFALSGELRPESVTSYPSMIKWALMCPLNDSRVIGAQGNFFSP